MAGNFFDQFDNAPPASANPPVGAWHPGGPNVFDQFDEPLVLPSDRSPRPAFGVRAGSQASGQQMGGNGAAGTPLVLPSDRGQLYSDADVGLGDMAPPAGGSQMLSDADVGLAPPADAGPLTNSGQEGWLSGVGKGAATAAIKGPSNIVGTPGNLRDLTGYHRRVA